MKDLGGEGFRGSKYIILVTTEAERLSREAKPLRDNAYPGPNHRVSLRGRGPLRDTPPTNSPEAAAAILLGGSGDSAPKRKSLS